MALPRLFVLLVALACAQTGATLPNFSGDWALIPRSDDPTDAGAAPQGRAVTIVQNGQTIIVTSTANFGNATTTHTYRLDGTSTKQEIKTGPSELRVESSTVTWRGSTLVVTTEWTAHRRTETFVREGEGTLVATKYTDLLSERNGRLTVSRIGPSTRSYRLVRR